MRQKHWRTYTLQAVPECHIEVGGKAAHNRLAVRTNATGEHSHFSCVKELHWLPYQRPEQL